MCLIFRYNSPICSPIAYILLVSMALCRKKFPTTGLGDRRNPLKSQSMNANNMINVVQKDVVVNCVKDSQEISNN